MVKQKHKRTGSSAQRAAGLAKDRAAEIRLRAKSPSKPENFSTKAEERESSCITEQAFG